MKTEKLILTIANLVVNCSHCQPLSGCILSDFKGQSLPEIISRLNLLDEAGVDRIISYHESCPYREKIAI